MSRGVRKTDLPRPRSDAKLKNLPLARQSEIASYAQSHSIKETVEWLRDQDFQTSSAAMSQFLSWYALGQRITPKTSAEAVYAKNIIQLIVRLHDRPEAQQVLCGTESEETKTEKLKEILFPETIRSPQLPQDAPQPTEGRQSALGGGKSAAIGCNALQWPKF